MKKLLMLATLCAIIGCINAQPRRGGATPDKSNDTILTTLKKTVIPKFQQLTYEDKKTGKKMEYNLFVPKDYDSSKSYPLVMFIADASCAGKGVMYPLEQGYGGLVWAAEDVQQRHPAFVLVPAYTEKAVDDDWNTTDEVEMTIRLLHSVVNVYNINTKRLYTTGQSMGGMMSMYYNIVYPKLFAASLFVGCQWDTSKMAGFADQTFFYIVAGGDEKAPKGMAALKDVLRKQYAKIGEATWSAKLPLAEQNDSVQALLNQGSDMNFIIFTIGSVMPESGLGNEHMNSFDYAYRLSAVQEWLLRQ